MRTRLSTMLIALLVSLSMEGAELPAVGTSFKAADSLASKPDAKADAQQCLDGLCWTPGEFAVSIEAAKEGQGDLLVRFPSARPRGNAVNDLAALEWYAVRDANGELATAPAMVVIHESGRSMPIGRMFARGFRQRGIHAFLLQLPGYGVRRTGDGAIKAEDLLPSLKQGVTDARRARDAVFVLPGIENTTIGLQGTSLGGFVASTAGALDDGFQHVFLTLSGGDLYSIVKSGKKDAARVRQRLEQAGVDDRQLHAMTQAIEPNRLAHRLPPEQTFVYSGLYDDVVPIENARSLVRASQLAAEHHICLPADHYTGIIFLPMILDHMAGQVRGEPVEAPSVN